MIDHMQRSHGLTFLFSDQTALPDRFFHGYAFVGRDYVSGPEGATQYEDETGRPILGGEDGCYVTVVRGDGEHHIGADHSGSKKLFYYRRGAAWCVSNSLVQMVEHLRERGIPLTLNFPQLTAFKASGTFASQMSTTTTIFNEVHLLPTVGRLAATPDGLRIDRALPDEPSSYPEALDQYVSTWLSRLRTLIHDGRTWLNADLSGGRDSRTVFAMISAATQAQGEADARRRINLRSSTSAQFAPDLEAATAIAEEYGWTLNGPMSGRPRLPRFSAEERYAGWRDLSLGVYMPVYFPDRRPHPGVVDLHGGGGENHRPFYPGNGLSDQVKSAQYLRPSYLAQAWMHDVLRSEGQLNEAWPGVPPLIAHYREYRNRFHGGLMAQYRTVFTPLGGRHLDLLSRHTAKVETGQINFDVMESLVPGLKDMPYDASKKEPSAENVENLTVSGLPYGSKAGRVYGSHDVDGPDTDRAPRGHLELMATDMEVSSRDRLVCEFLGEEIIAKANTGIGQALEHGKFVHPADAKDVSRVLAAAFAFDASGLTSPR